MGFWSSLVSTLLGVGASLVAWYIIKSIKPRICISEQIEKTFSPTANKEGATYRISLSKNLWRMEDRGPFRL